MSPKAYAQALALHRLTRGAGAGRTALDAVLDAGFGTTSTAYAAAAGTLGVTPGRLRGAIDIGWWMGLSDLGWMLLGATPHGICWLAFGDAPGALFEDMRAAFPKAHLHNDESRLYAWFLAVRDFVLLPREALALPMDIQGTAFQSRVWKALRRIPVGATLSYREVAASLGEPTATRAVATACARNQVALLIPCHRVIGRGRQSRRIPLGACAEEGAVDAGDCRSSAESVTRSGSPAVRRKRRGVALLVGILGKIILE